MAEPNEMTAEQKKCADEVGHDFDWHSPEIDIGFWGYGQCKLCGWDVPYEEPGDGLDD